MDKDINKTNVEKGKSDKLTGTTKNMRTGLLALREHLNSNNKKSPQRTEIRTATKLFS